MACKVSLIVGLLILLPNEYELITSLEPRVYDEFVFQGNIALFRCQIPDHLKDSVRVKSWYLSNGITLKSPENRDKFTVLPSGELIIRSVDSEDSYLKVRCEVKNDKTGRTSITSTPGKLTVIEAKNPSSPKIFFQLPQISARDGDDNVYLPCIASGYPLSKYEWFIRISNSDSRISLSSLSDDYVPLSSLLTSSSLSSNRLAGLIIHPHRYKITDGLLIISEPKSTDSNQFRCIISNNLGRVKCDIKLTVYSHLKVTINTVPPTEYTTNSNSNNVNLDRTFSGSGKSVSSLKGIGSTSSTSSSTTTLSSSSSSQSVGVTRIPISLGSSLSLNCTVKGFPVKDIKWTKDSKTLLESILTGTSRPLTTVKGSSLSSSSLSTSSLSRETDYHHYHQQQQSNSHHSIILDLISLDRKHEGFYICLASNDLASTQQTIQLYFDDEVPVFEETFNDQLLSLGTSLSLICSARGRPLPQITWAFDMEPLKSSHRIRYADFVSQRDKVTSYVNITSVRSEDAGLYQCIAKNSAGQSFHQKRVNIYGEPGVKPMVNRTVLEGESIWFYCPVYGYPHGEINWLKDDEQIPSNGRQEVFTNGSLLVKNVNRKVDEGYYSCQLSSSLKGSSDYPGNSNKKHSHFQQQSQHQSKCFLKIMVGPRIDPFVFPKDMEEGMRSVAFCSVSSGDGPIHIDWYKDGIKLDSNEFGTRIEMLNSFTSTITFQSLTTQHTGNYTCLASNSASSVNYTAEMIVKVSPTWIKEPIDLEVINGARVILDCQASGFPEPQIRWKKEEVDPNEAKATFKTIISNPHIHILENGSLFINLVGSSDSGKYMCQATNGVNPALSKVINLKAHSPPTFGSTFVSKIVKKSESVRLTCNASGDNPLSYSWKKDDVDLEQLMIGGRYRMEENKKTSVSDNLISSVDLIIGSVDRSDSALFTCISTNPFGSAEKTFRLIVQETPETPINLNTGEVKSDSLLISWSEPYNGNSPIMEYIVQYRPISSSSSWNTKVTESRDSGLSTSLYIDNLKPTTNYEFRVIAKNALGSSESSQSITQVTLEKEPVFPPQDVRITPKGSSILKISWNPPKSSDGDSKEPRITGYHIAYRKAEIDSPYFIKTVEVSGSASGSKGAREEYTIGGLEKLTRYEVKVQGFNTAGDGPFSDPLSGETLQYDAPKSPLLNVVGSSPSTIDLSWEPSGDEPVTGYLIFYRAEGKEWISQQVNSLTSYTIYQAQCGTKYQIYVLGLNDAGQGDHSDTIIARTEGTAPVAPDKSSFLQSNSTAVLLNLHAWHSNGCPILAFDIQYKRNGDREWILLQSSVPATTPTITIPDLLPATWYNLLMRAENEAGTTDAEFVFATTTIDGTLIPPLSVSTELDGESGNNKLSFTSKWVVQQLNLILPILCGLGVLTLGLIVICSLQMRKAYIQNGGNSDPGLSVSATLNESVYKIENNNNNGDLGSPVISSTGNPYKTESTSTEIRSTCETVGQLTGIGGIMGNGNAIGGGGGGGINIGTGIGYRQSGGTSIYYPSPYALSRIEEYRTQEYGKSCDETYKLRPLNRPTTTTTSTTGHPYHHDYDTPIFLKRVNLNSVSPSLE